MNKKLKQLIAMLAFSFSVMNAMAQTSSNPRLLANQATAVKIFSEWKGKAIRDLEKIKMEGRPRKVQKGRLPEIKMAQDKIYFNNKQLRLGASLATWTEIIPGRPRCTEPEMSLCIWDKLGLSVGVDEGGDHNVRYLNIQISLSEEDKEIGTVPFPDGKPAGVQLDLSPHMVFPGYLELDGFGIDAGTEFWDIRKSCDPSRRLDCGLMDCSHPSGAFGENAHIYIRLDGNGKNSKLREISLDAID